MKKKNVKVHKDLVQPQHSHSLEKTIILDGACKNYQLYDWPDIFILSSSYVFF